jgi:hypothetical protein
VGGTPRREGGFRREGGRGGPPHRERGGGSGAPERRPEDRGSDLSARPPHAGDPE